MYCSAPAMLSTRSAWRTVLMAFANRCDDRVYETERGRRRALEAEDVHRIRGGGWRRAGAGRAGRDRDRELVARLLVRGAARPAQRGAHRRFLARALEAAGGLDQRPLDGGLLPPRRPRDQARAA